MTKPLHVSLERLYPTHGRSGCSASHPWYPLDATALVGVCSPAVLRRRFRLPNVLRFECCYRQKEQAGSFFARLNRVDAPGKVAQTRRRKQIRRCLRIWPEDPLQ